MKGLDDRSRNENGRIREKRGDTQNQNLPKPIPGFGPKTTLEKMRQVTNQQSEAGVRREAEKRRGK